MTVQLLLLSRRFLPLTKTDSADTRDRGSVAVLSILWLGLAAFGCSALLGMTHLVSERAQLQNAADVVALAMVTAGEARATVLAGKVDVTIDHVDWNGGEVTVVVSHPGGWATATATRS